MKKYSIEAGGGKTRRDVLRLKIEHVPRSNEVLATDIDRSVILIESVRRYVQQRLTL